jgi:hypothetical protein
MPVALFCNACGAQLTEPLELRSGKDPSVPAPSMEPRMCLSARGEVYKSYDPIERSYGEAPALLEFTPQYWVNPEDLTDRVQLTKRRRRLGGCCGLAGSDGPNQLCRCGAEVGTLRTDCWTPRVFIPVPENTSWEKCPEGIRNVTP